MRAYAGVTHMINQDARFNPEGTRYTGAQAGIDGRLMSGGMSFVVGGQYARISRLPSEDAAYLGLDASMSLFRGRGGLEFTIFEFAKGMRVRSKILAEITGVLGTSGEGWPDPDDRLNSGWGSGVTGLGLDISSFTFDVEFAYGALNAYQQQKSATFNRWSFQVGVFF